MFASMSASMTASVSESVHEFDSRHIEFIQKNGVHTYNCYFNRDNKFVIPDEPEYTYDGIPPPMPGSGCSLEPGNWYLRRTNPFYNEYRDGDTAVPRPLETNYYLVEPDNFTNVPFEYIKDHGVLEYILETGYPYSLMCLLNYSKISQYQMIYLHKLMKEGRLTSHGKKVECVHLNCNLAIKTATAHGYN